MRRSLSKSSLTEQSRTEGQVPTTEDLKCFVIGPIGDKDADEGSQERQSYENAIEVLEEVVQPACRAFALEPLRADEISNPGEIPEQIFRHLRDDDVVVADLTGANANVMYELGLRHTTGKLTIQLGERGTLPFDVSAIRTILFKRTAGGLVAARKSLSAAISAGLEGRLNYVTATRVFLGGARKLEELALDSIDEQTEELGFLEKIAAMEEVVGEIAPTLNQFTEIYKTIGEIVSEAGELAGKEAASGHKVKIANRAAARLRPIAEKLDATVVEFREQIEKLDPGTQALLQLLRSQEETEEARSFIESVNGAAESVGSTVEGARELADKMAEAGEATRDLRKVSNRLARSLRYYAELAQRVRTWKDLT